MVSACGGNVLYGNVMDVASFPSETSAGNTMVRIDQIYFVSGELSRATLIFKAVQAMGSSLVVPEMFWTRQWTEPFLKLMPSPFLTRVLNTM